MSLKDNPPLKRYDEMSIEELLQEMVRINGKNIFGQMASEVIEEMTKDE